MTKKELWDYEFDRPRVMTRDFRPGKCSICDSKQDIRFMKAFERTEEDEIKYICKECFIK